MIWFFWISVIRENAALDKWGASCFLIATRSAKYREKDYLHFLASFQNKTFKKVLHLLFNWIYEYKKPKPPHTYLQP